MKQIPNFSNYLVNESGEVFSISRNQKLKPWTKPDGYKFVRLYKDGKYHNWYVHRLVAATFIENPENKKCVNHINSNRGDNRLINLEWCTHKENLQHSFESVTGANDYKTYRFVKNGEVITICNLKEYCEANNLGYLSMIKVYTDSCANKSHKGFSKY